MPYSLWKSHALARLKIEAPPVKKRVRLIVIQPSQRSQEDGPSQQSNHTIQQGQDNTMTMGEVTLDQERSSGNGYTGELLSQCEFDDGDC